MAGTWYVDDDNYNPAYSTYADYENAGLDGKSEATAFGTIQIAVTKASNSDTIIVLPGTYDKDSGSGLGNARVHIAKYGLTLRSKEGKAVTHIVGAPDPETGGAGPNALKCVFIANNHVTVEGFTLRGGRSADASDTGWPGRGGAAGSNYGTGENYLVDCAIYDTISSYAAVFQVNCLRCEISGCTSLVPGDPHIYSANLINCFVHDNKANNYLIWGGKICNTTVASEANYSHMTRASSIYNCIFDSGNGDMYTPNVTSNISLRGSVLIAPAAGDCHPRAGTAADGTGDAQCIGDLGVRDDLELYFDFEGKPIPKTGRINLGCYQSTKAAAGGRINFAGTYSVDGNYPHRVAAYAYPETYPTQFMVTAATGRLVKGVITGAASAVRTPDLDDTIALMPPAGANQAITFTAHAAEAELWVAADGNDETGDGTQKNPYRTIQHAIDAASTNTVVNVGPGTYGIGEAHYPVNASSEEVTQYGKAAVTVYDKCVRVVSTEGAEKTFIVGTVDPDYAADATLPGCGPNAARCVLMSGGSNNGSSVSGFTLTGGATARSGDAVSWGGGYFCPKGYNAVTDCIVSNNAAHVCAGGYAGRVERCLFMDNKGDGSTAGGDWNSPIFGCVFAGNPASSTANGAICGNAIAYNCTLIGASDEFPFAQNASGTKIYNSIIFGGDQNCPNMTRSGNVLWGGTDPDLRTSEKFADPLFAAPAAGDYSIKSISPALGAGDLTAGNYFANSSTGYGGGRLIFTNGLPLAGAVQDLAACGAELFVDAANGGIAVEDGVIGYNDMSLAGMVTLAPTNGTRPCVGYLVNGVTNYFADLGDGRRFITVDQAVAAGGINVTALYSQDWHVDAVSGNDANPGCKAFPLRTLAASMENAAAGDTVHAAPGDYNQGMMCHDPNYNAVSSRVVVASNVELIADEGPEVTFITGANSPNPVTPTPSSLFAGGGPGAVRCVYLRANATVRGFTIRNGRQNGTSDNDANGHAAGILGTSAWTATAYNCVITNCCGWRGGGVHGVTAVNCRFVDCKSASGSAGRGAAFIGCVFGPGCNGQYIDYPSGSGVHNCTFLEYANAVANCGNSTPVCNSIVIGKVVAKSTNLMTLRNCIITPDAIDEASAPYVTLDNCREMDAAEMLLNEDGSLQSGSPAIDTGSNQLVRVELDGKDFCGGQRIYNGNVDVGAYEYDWRASYARTIHPSRCAVTAASPDVLQGEGKVLVTGTLDATFIGTGGGRRYSVKVPVNVTGNGRLDIVSDGAVLASYTLADGAQTFVRRSVNDTDAYSFVYVPGESDTGCAEIGSALWHAAGFSIGFR